MPRKLRRPRPVQQIRRAQNVFNKYRVCELALRHDQMMMLMTMITQAIKEVESPDDVIIFHFLSVHGTKESLQFNGIHVQRLGATIDIFPCNAKGKQSAEFDIELAKQLLNFIQELDQTLG